jgi:hypothetical protein
MKTLEINFDFDTEGVLHADALLDPYELNVLFDQTRSTLRRDLERKLSGVVCAEHDEPPRITISGRYDHDTEQMDINYHIDTCCQMFLVRVVKTLNQTE